jgi:hypothetical protein
MAQVQSSGYAEAYLQRNVGARALGMSGAYTAVTNEATTLYYNPAGMAFLSDKPIFSTSYTFLEYGRQHTTLSYGQSLFENFGVGAMINSFAAGSIVARNAQGQSLGTNTNQQTNFTAGVAYRITDYISAGVAGKYYLNNLQGSTEHAQGFGFDLGMKMDVLDAFSIGISAQNLLSAMKWYGITTMTEAIPFTIRAGLATEIGLNTDEYTARTNIRGETDTVLVPATRYVLLSLDAVMRQNAYAPTIYFGAEVLPIEILAIRAGMALIGEENRATEFFPGSQFGAGLSLRLPALDLPFQMQLDYAINKDAVAESQLAHCLSLLAEF